MCLVLYFLSYYYRIRISKSDDKCYHQYRFNISFRFAIFLLYVKFSFLNFHGTGEKKSYKLTQESIEMAKKIEGLKNYLKDFSIIYDCSYKEKIQWERF